MNLSSEIQKCAQDTFHVAALKPYQLLVTHRIVEQFSYSDVENQIVILPTGSGKSLCFLVPAVMSKKISIIVYPLLALMNDQLDKLNKAGVDSINLRGGQTREERQTIYNKLRNGTKIIITNPETLTQPSVIKMLFNLKIELFVIDEAHVLSQWGKSFRPAYLELGKVIEQLKPHQVVAFTATATQQTIKDIKVCLFKDDPLLVQADTDRDNIFYASYPALSKDEGLIELLRFCTRPAIVFCGTRQTTYKLCMYMKSIYPSYPMKFYNAGLGKAERLRIENWYRNTEQAVLFATCAYGLGVDLPGIRTIIHYDLPEDALEYLQEAGRAGRDHNDANAWVIVPYQQENYGGLLKVFTQNTCRRRALLAELGEIKEECSGCDICTKTTIKYPYGYQAAKALIGLYPFSFTIDSAAGVLTGDPIYISKKYNPFFGTLEMDGIQARLVLKAMHFGCVDRKKLGPVLYIDNRINRFIAHFFVKIAKKKNP